MGRIVLIILLLSYTNAFALTNSVPAIGDNSTFNVWIEIDAKIDGKIEKGYCNGSLIADDLVITAAHCLAASTDLEDQAIVNVGNYKSTKALNGNVYSNYHGRLDRIQSKKFYFLSSIDKKMRAGRMTHPSDISPYLDMALIELDRPIDRSKVDVKLVSPVTPDEYAHLSYRSQDYTFIVLSTNPTTEMSTQTKRYVEMRDMNFATLTNKFFGLPMTNTVRKSETEPGDSGAPVLVNISGQWKLVAVVKGTKSDFISLKLKEYSDKPIQVLPLMNMYAPIANGICDLLTQAGRVCD